MGDRRIQCRYGANCFQTNPQHQKKFKHPIKENSVKKKRRHSNSEAVVTPEKKLKLDAPVESSTEIEDIEFEDSDKIIISKLPDNVPDKIKSIFQVNMPPDFYEFYSFCKTLGSKTVKYCLSPLHLVLVGPFDVYFNELKNCSQDEALRHYRYYYDPPEFQTVLKGNDKTGLHYGYFRDDPNELPTFVGRNEAETNCTIDVVGANLFGALNFHIQKVIAFADPFNKIKILKISATLKKWCKNKNIILDATSKEIRNRKSHIVTNTYHSAGIVVPMDKTTQVGYRELAMDDKELKQLLKLICETTSDEERKAFLGKLQPVVTFANIANDECDFGTSLHLGINLFCYGSDVLHKIAHQQLTTAYKLLKRDLFADIITAHLENRVKDTKQLNTIALN